MAHAERQRAAGERDRASDERDPLAQGREPEPGEQEREAGEREALADERDRKAQVTGMPGARDRAAARRKRLLPGDWHLWGRQSKKQRLSSQAFLQP